MVALAVVTPGIAVAAQIHAAIAGRAGIRGRRKACPSALKMPDEPARMATHAARSHVLGFLKTSSVVDPPLPCEAARFDCGLPLMKRLALVAPVLISMSRTCEQRQDRTNRKKNLSHRLPFMQLKQSNHRQNIVSSMTRGVSLPM